MEQPFDTRLASSPREMVEQPLNMVSEMTNIADSNQRQSDFLEGWEDRLSGRGRWPASEAYMRGWRAARVEPRKRYGKKDDFADPNFNQFKYDQRKP